MMITKKLMCSMAMLLGATLSGCGNGGDGSSIASVGVDSSSNVGGTSVNATAGITTPIVLASAAPFGIAATAGITNTNTLPITTINSDVVLDPTTTCNGTAVPGGTDSAGFGPCGSTNPTSVPTLTGTIYISGDTPTAGVIADLKAGFLKITPSAGPPAKGSLDGATNLPAGTTLGNVTGSALVAGDNLFYPGLYQSTTSIMITDDLTLDAQGNPDAVFVFQSSNTLGTADGSAPPGTPHTRILLKNGAKASNVWWQVGTSATLGLYSEFQGNILASESITMNTGATSCGRLLAGRLPPASLPLIPTLSPCQVSHLRRQLDIRQHASKQALNIKAHRALLESQQRASLTLS